MSRSATKYEAFEIKTRVAECTCPLSKHSLKKVAIQSDHPDTEQRHPGFSNLFKEYTGNTSVPSVSEPHGGNSLPCHKRASLTRVTAIAAKLAVTRW
mmetsp:Transcript_2673/g.9594  ORF Transcript_2673/g.9594 Transcript_2673/m.9594 type:complete len:97 (-) Transcript_2673:511-801(-)